MRIQSYNRYDVLTDGEGAAYPDRQDFGASAISLPTVPSGVNCAYVSVIASSSSTAGDVIANWRIDGQNPSSAKGNPLYAGGEVQLFESELANFKIISADGNTHKLCVEFGVVS